MPNKWKVPQEGDVRDICQICGVKKIIDTYLLNIEIYQSTRFDGVQNNLISHNQNN